MADAKNNDAEDVSRLENDGAPADKLSDEERSERARRGAEKAGKDGPTSPDRDVTTATHEDPDKQPPEGSTDHSDVPKPKGPLTKAQEAAEEGRNRAQETSSETPAGDPSPDPQASASANEVDAPGRAHTLSTDESGTAQGLGERLRAAKETEQLEIRPATHPGIRSDLEGAPYDVEAELRAQWPGIELGDYEEE
jgi:hypothetical protein